MSGDNETLRNIMGRRSCRKFEDRPVPRDVLETIVSAGRAAPTAMNRQELNFYVMTDPAAVERLGSETMALASMPHLHARVKDLGITNAITCGAPALVVLTAAADLASSLFLGVDAGLAVENILVAAKSLGVRGLPVGCAQMFNEAGILRAVAAPEGEHVLLVVALGYPHPDYDKTFLPEKPITSKVVYL